MLAASAAIVMTSGLALNHVAAQPSPGQEADIAPPIATAAAAPQSEAAAQDAADQAPEPDARPRLDPRQINCIAKVVHHEAGNQPREGQIAVAHVMVNRVKRGFGDDVCDVANQPGQFFRLSRYHPNRNTAAWAAAVDVARTVLSGSTRDYSKGALYFHANWAKPDRFFRGRTKLTRLEDHDFYR
ncbi:cell wall hydrolase [Sandarakinorhabdus sp.]|uniref:cell wall hydrolase n=1 Tax=Sandarakinorhabdus sp. TaxID=1916663 RepID=UPI00334191E1